MFRYIARIFTVLLSTGDKMLLINFVASFAGSASILISALHYKKSTKKSE